MRTCITVALLLSLTATMIALSGTQRSGPIREVYLEAQRHPIQVGTAPKSYPLPRVFTENIRWYEEGTVTRSGEKFQPDEFTFASNSPELFPGTRVKVTYQNKSVIVRCNDTGPNLVELTRGAFMALAPLSVGVINAQIEILND